MKRSRLPKMARWIMTGVCFAPVLADIEGAQPLRQVEVELHACRTASARPMASRSVNSSFGP